MKNNSEELKEAYKLISLQTLEKEKRVNELFEANKELAFQLSEKEKRAAELLLANEELAFQNSEKEKRAAELIIANTELVFQNEEKEKRAAELLLANAELAFQNSEKEKRAAELIIANTELVFQNEEKEKRAAELLLANAELAFQNSEKEKRAAELIIANTELVFQNEEKEKRAMELSMASEDLATLTYLSSHDLQEPLRKIQIFIACILEQEENLSVSGKNYFLRVMKTANRMQRLIEDLLKYSEAKIGDHVFVKTDLNDLVAGVMEDLKEVIHQTKAIITVSVPDSITAIPFQLRQLFNNLISNSCKFHRKDTQLQISITGAFKMGRELNNEILMADKSYYHIIFTDNGIGFEPQYKDRIFEVFQRLHDRDEYKGTGIGLAICKRIVENHSGSISATGSKGKGCRIDLYFAIMD